MKRLLVVILFLTLLISFVDVSSAEEEGWQYIGSNNQAVVFEAPLVVYDENSKTYTAWIKYQYTEAYVKKISDEIGLKIPVSFSRSEIKIDYDNERIHHLKSNTYNKNDNFIYSKSEVKLDYINGRVQHLKFNTYNKNGNIIYSNTSASEWESVRTGIFGEHIFNEIYTMQPKKILNNFSKLIEKEDFDDLRLTIYYMNKDILTRVPLDAVNLIRERYLTTKIVVYGDKLKEQIDLLRQINTDILIPVENKSYLNARLCYVFETDKDGKILEVAMAGPYGSIVFVNGLKVKGNNIFTDVIKPFLTEDATKELGILQKKTVNS